MLVTKTFSFLHTKFSTHSIRDFCFNVTFILSSANALNLDQSQNWLFGKELNASVCMVLNLDQSNKNFV